MSSEDRTITFTLTGKEPYGLVAVVRWLKEGLHLLLMDGPTRRAVDKLYAALEERGAGMIGRRHDVPLHEMEPGDYGFTAAWFCCAPNGFGGNLSRHEVVEHEDGTITVSPSILISGASDSWHGFLERGIWRSA